MAEGVFLRPQINLMEYYIIFGTIGVFLAVVIISSNRRNAKIQAKWDAEKEAKELKKAEEKAKEKALKKEYKKAQHKVRGSDEAINDMIEEVNWLMKERKYKEALDMTEKAIVECEKLQPLFSQFDDHFGNRSWRSVSLDQWDLINKIEESLRLKLRGIKIIKREIQELEGQDDAKSSE